MSALDDLQARLRKAIEALPDGLRDHILRVAEESRWLAEHHAVDPNRARVAALGHDLVRHLPGPELLDLARRYDLSPDPVETASPILVHGPVAARILARDYGVEDEDVLAGIDCHTTARPGMTPLEQVLFVADKVEPQKLKHEPALETVRERAESSLEAAVLAYLDLNIGQALRRGWLIHPRTFEARNHLIQARPPTRLSP